MAFFISYQHDSKKFAMQLNRRLEAAGIVTFIDGQIKVAEPWKEVIDKKIQQSIGVIVIITQKALESQWVTYEWAYARGLGKPIIPILLEKLDSEHQMHPRLGDIQYRDFSGSKSPPWKQLIEELLEMETAGEIPDSIRNAEETLRSSHKPDEWKSAVELLLKDPRSAAVEALARQVGNVLDEISIQSALALAEKQKYADDRAIVGLKKGLFDRGVRERACDLLGSYRSKQAAEAIVEALGQIESGRFKVKLIRTLAPFPFPFVVRHLLTYLESNDGNEVASACYALGTCGDRSILPQLWSVLNTHGYEPTRVEAARAIGNLASTEEIPDLLKYVDSLANGRDNHRASAAAVIELLGTIGDQQTYKELARRLNYTGYSLMRDLISTAMSKILTRNQSKPT